MVNERASGVPLVGEEPNCRSEKFPARVWRGYSAPKHGSAPKYGKPVKTWTGVIGGLGSPGGTGIPALVGLHDN